MATAYGDDMMEVHKNVARIPVTRELLIDAGHIGPLATWDDDANRYRALWHEARSEGPWGWVFRLAPPWESPDRPALPVFAIWPGRLGRLLDWFDNRG